MIRADKEDLESIGNLLNNASFERFISWLNRGFQKDVDMAINELGYKEQYWAQGRCQELNHIMNTIDSVRNKQIITNKSPKDRSKFR